MGVISFDRGGPEPQRPTAKRGKGGTLTRAREIEGQKLPDALTMAANGNVRVRGGNAEGATPQPRTGSPQDGTTNTDVEALTMDGPNTSTKQERSKKKARPAKNQQRKKRPVEQRTNKGKTRRISGGFAEDGTPVFAAV